MGIGDWGLGIGPNPQSPIPNPQSPIPIKKCLKIYFFPKKLNINNQINKNIIIYPTKNIYE